MSEPTWWQEWREIASPMWLFRARPAEYADHGGICMGSFWLPGLSALLAVHFLLLGIPVQIWLLEGWHPLLALWMSPLAVSWAVLIPADIKFRRQGATWEQIIGFDNTFINWFGFVTMPLMPVVVVAVIAWFVWLVVRLFV